MAEVTDYDPFGSSFEHVNVAQNRYLYNGKELQDQAIGGTPFGWYDYGARFYDPELGRWHVMDGKAELYWHVTPYAYALNTPNNAIDPNGHIVVFINGNHYGDGGKAAYWRQYETTFKGYEPVGSRYAGVYEKREVYAFDKEVMDRLGDHKAIYRDGAVGGWAPLNHLTGGSYSNTRQYSGYCQGLEDAPAIIDNLERDKSGNIIESIKIITHSMGGAYGKGYVLAIIEYAKKHGINSNLIAFEADFAPFQPGGQTAVNGVPTFQFSNDNDPVANNSLLGSPFARIKGANVTTDSNPNKGHSIFDFMDKIRKLPAGKYKVVNGEIVPE